MLSFLGFMAIFSNPWVLLAFILLAIWAEHGESRFWAGTGLIASIAIAYSLFELTLMQWLIVGGVWIPVGLVWAIWRFRRQAKKAVKEYRAGRIDAYQAEYLANASKHRGTIIYWTLAFPISFVESIVGDVIDVVESAFSGIFARISRAALGDIAQITAERESQSK